MWQTFLAQSLIKPIELMAQHLEDDKATETYEEIQPFMDKIHSQHKALKKSSKMRQEFTANVSHELKNTVGFNFRLRRTDRNRNGKRGRYPAFCQ